MPRRQFDLTLTSALPREPLARDPDDRLSWVCPPPTCKSRGGTSLSAYRRSMNGFTFLGLDQLLHEQQVLLVGRRRKRHHLWVVKIDASRAHASGGATSSPTRRRNTRRRCPSAARRSCNRRVSGCRPCPASGRSARPLDEVLLEVSITRRRPAPQPYRRCGCCTTAVTWAPSAFAIWTAQVPTPPEAPLIKTFWPGCSPPASRSPCSAAAAHGTAAALRTKGWSA